MRNSIRAADIIWAYRRSFDKLLAYLLLAAIVAVTSVAPILGLDNPLLHATKAASALSFGAALLRGAILAGCANVIAQRDELNRINVFPVADGDTGTNLALTLGAVFECASAHRDVSLDSLSHHRHGEGAVGLLLHSIASAAIDGARGNSGAIMAQFFFGLSQNLASAQRVSLKTLAQAVEFAAKTARQALAEPVEGTIISVITSYAQALKREGLRSHHSFINAFATALAAAQRTLAKTPKMLAVLAQKGVVDAGGSGFVMFLEGAQAFIAQGPRALKSLSYRPERSLQASASLHIDDAHSRYRFCSECLLTQADLVGLRSAMGNFELDSMVIAGGTDRARLHAHTDNPAALFELAAKFAKVSQRKADDMQAQARARQNAGRVVVVTDTGADLPESEIERLNLFCVPVRIMFGDDEYIDRITLTPAQMYQKLRAGNQTVRTSQPPSGDFRRLFDQLLSHFDEIVCLNVSGRMSGTWQAALAAAKLAAPDRIRVLDTRNAAAGQALLVLRAGQLAADGKTGAQIAADFERMRPRTHTFALVRDVQYGVRGGRIPAWVGPLVRVLRGNLIIADDGLGKIKPCGLLWGKRNLAERFALWAAKRIAKLDAGANASIRIILGDADASADMQPCTQALLRSIPNLASLHLVEAGTAIGAHAGPGSIVIGFQRLLPGELISK